MMHGDLLFEQSEALAVDVTQAIALPLYDDSQRFEVSGLLCSLAVERDCNEACG